MSTYKQNRSWSDKFLPDITDLIQNMADQGMLKQYRPHIVRTSTVVEDTQHATDLVVTASGINVSCRVRRHDKIKYKEVTIRSLSRKGYEGKTELEKLRGGEGDYMLYCHCNKNESNICRYILLDLFFLRAYIDNNIEDLPTIRNTDRYNRYDGTGFITINLYHVLSTMPAAIVHSYPDIDKYMAFESFYRKNIFQEVQGALY